MASVCGRAGVSLRPQLFMTVTCQLHDSYSNSRVRWTRGNLRGPPTSTLILCPLIPFRSTLSGEHCSGLFSAALGLQGFESRGTAAGKDRLGFIYGRRGFYWGLHKICSLGEEGLWLGPV